MLLSEILQKPCSVKVAVTVAELLEVEEDTTGDYELQEIIVEDDLTLGSKTAFTANAGDDQYPVTVVDSNDCSASASATIS